MTAAGPGRSLLQTHSADDWEGAALPSTCCPSRWDVDPDAVQGWEELSAAARHAALVLGYSVGACMPAILAGNVHPAPPAARRPRPV